MIIGITGTHGAGKDTVAQYLVNKGFAHVATGDLIREEALRRGLPTDRPTLQAIIKEWRAKEGPAALVKEALRRIGHHDAVVSGLRHTAEVETLRHEATGPVVVWAIDAPARLRWQRIRSRGRPGDDLTWEEFVAQEQREQGSDPSTFHIARTMARADTTIQNDGTLDDLYRTVENLLSEAKKKKR